MVGQVSTLVQYTCIMVIRLHMRQRLFRFPRSRVVVLTNIVVRALTVVTKVAPVASVTTMLNWSKVVRSSEAVILFLSAGNSRHKHSNRIFLHLDVSLIDIYY